MVDSVAQLSAFRQPPWPSTSVALPLHTTARPTLRLHPISGEGAPSSLLDFVEVASFLDPLKDPLSILLCTASFGELGVSTAEEPRETLAVDVLEAITGTIPSRAQDPLAPPIESDGKTVRSGLVEDLDGGAENTVQLISYPSEQS